MASFPTLSTGSISCWGLQRTVRTGTRIHRFEDDSEQRYRDYVAASGFILRLDSISGADYDLVQTFFDARAGDFDATWDVTVNGMLYSNCVFQDAGITRSEMKPGRVTVSIRVLQTRP